MAHNELQGRAFIRVRVDAVRRHQHRRLRHRHRYDVKLLLRRDAIRNQLYLLFDFTIEARGSRPRHADASMPDDSLVIEHDVSRKRSDSEGTHNFPIFVAILRPCHLVLFSKLSPHFVIPIRTDTYQYK